MKAALMDRVAGLGFGPDVEVSYSDTRADSARTRIWGGKVTSTQTPIGMKGTSGRVKRQEEASVSLHIAVVMPDATQAEAEVRAVELGQQVEDMLATDPTLATTTGLLKCLVSSVDLDSYTDDDAAFAFLDYQIDAMSYLD
jgi:hypothetical protein